MDIKYTLYALIICAFCGASCARTTDGYHTIEGYAQGGTYKITLHTCQDNLAQIKRSIDSLLNVIDNSISGYNDSSLVSKINRCDTLATEDHIFLELLEISRRFYDLTDGYFDPSAGALFDAWGFGFKQKSFPDGKTIDSLKSFIGMDMIRYENGTIIKSDPRVTLNFNAIAQGYSCDLVGQLLESRGIKDMLVNIGGEIFCKGLNSKGGEWVIGIDAPIDGNDIEGDIIQSVILIDTSMEGKGVVTSGNYRKFYILDGKKYAHTIDPKAGRPVSHNLLSATVITDNATDADALATYFMTIGFEKSREYILTHPQTEGVLIYEQGSEMTLWKSDGIQIRQPL